MCLHAQLCPTLCDPKDYGPPGSSVRGISQARMLEQVAFHFSRKSSQPGIRTCISCIGRWILYHQTTWEAISHIMVVLKYSPAIKSLFLPKCGYHDILRVCKGLEVSYFLGVYLPIFFYIMLL